MIDASSLGEPLEILADHSVEAAIGPVLDGDEL